MAYATSNPPRLLSQPIAGQRLWQYVSADAAATVDTGLYFSDGDTLGMKVDDLVIVHDTGNNIVTTHVVLTVTAGSGAGVGDPVTVGDATDTD